MPEPVCLSDSLRGRSRRWRQIAGRYLSLTTGDLSSITKRPCSRRPRWPPPAGPAFSRGDSVKRLRGIGKSECSVQISNAVFTLLREWARPWTRRVSLPRAAKESSTTRHRARRERLAELCAKAGSRSSRKRDVGFQAHASGRTGAPAPVPRGRGPGGGDRA